MDDRTVYEIASEEIAKDDSPDWGPKPDPAGVIEWLDNPRFFERPKVPKTRLGRLRVLFRWYVMDRLRYLGLWPRRPHPSHYGKLPSGTIWGDLWRRSSLRPGA